MCAGYQCQSRVAYPRETDWNKGGKAAFHTVKSKDANISTARHSKAPAISDDGATCGKPERSNLFRMRCHSDVGLVTYNESPINATRYLLDVDVDLVAAI